MRIFALTRYFSLISLVFILIAGGSIGLLVQEREVQQLEKLVEDRNVVMTQVFLNVLSEDFPVMLKGNTDVPDHLLHQSLATKIHGLMRNSDIAKIKLYNLNGKVVFSTDPTQIGDDKKDNPAFLLARSGQPNSELVHRQEFSSSEGERHNIDLVSSYIPMQQSGSTLAVFEVYQDVTGALQRIRQAVWQTLGIIMGILGLLYLMQLLVVRHAQNVIRGQEKLLEGINQELDRKITERTKALEESQLQISQLLDEQQLIFNNAHVGILLLKNRRILKGNQRIADMFGFANPAEFIGLSTEIFYRTHDEFLFAGKTGYQQLAEKGFADFEVKMRRKGGEDFWVIQSGRPLNQKDVLQNPSIWVYTDITERKAAEVEMGIAAAAFQSQEGMLVTDANGTILRVNKAFSDTTGFSPEEVAGKTPRILRSDRHDTAFFTAMWESISKTGYWQGEIWDKHKSGKVYPKWLTISAVKDRNGQVTHYVGTHTDITERKIAEEKIRHLAFYDQLTELPNRTLLMDRLTQARSASERNGTHGALLFLDLDHFKALNDTLGHDHGDMLLKQVAKLLLANVRQGDTVARLGGDEFVILLLELDERPFEAASNVETTCRKLLAALKQDYLLAGTEFHSSASIGATLFMGEKTPIEELLKQADLAMYKSKEAGRNAFTFFDPTMEASVLARTQIETDLRRAILDEQFVLYYQPQIDGNRGHLIGAEALIRWQHPGRGMVQPNDFIQNAEESGLILPIGHWVLESVCRQLAAWGQQADKAHLGVSVNVSAQQFRQPDFARQVLSLLEKTGANPEKLKLELTESIFVHNVEDIIEKMTVLKAIGVGFSLDDFGTGYSSLAYLSRLPLDQLKIDRSFVMDIENSENNIAICAATISLAHSLGIKVVAEGVETDAQRYFLTTVHHCDFLQGFLIGQPLPLDAFEAFLKS